MLFLCVGQSIGGDVRPALARRIEWDYPQDLKVIAEYWPQNTDFQVVSIIEADSIAPIMAVTTEWSDTFKWSVAPAITAEEGIAAARSMTQQ